MTTKDPNTVHCRNPDPKKNGTNIPRWKFEAVRVAIARVLADYPEGVVFKALPPLVKNALTANEVDRLGSISWHTTVVKLHLEASSEIGRVPGAKPQIIRAIRK